MKTYLVGGAVRDELLHQPVKDRDWVVVGSTPQEMLDAGFTQVGKDFPVYLHPETKEEYALARTERKSGSGYYGFEVNVDASITLEDDLRRRDVTCNAIAKDPDTNEIIDPFSGVKDLREGILRHISEAFSEDPVRVLRIARFAARYNFVVARETIELMKKLVESGELNHLIPERVWQELSRGIMEEFPNHFFFVLQQCGAEQVLFPEAARCIFNTGKGVLRCSLYKLTLQQHIAAWLYQLDADTAVSFLERLKAPNDIIFFTKTFIELIEVLKEQPTPETVLDFFNRIRIWQRSPTIYDLCDFAYLIFIIDCDDRWSSRMDVLKRIFNECVLICFAWLTEEQRNTLQGQEIQNAINELRLEKITRMFDKYIL